MSAGHATRYPIRSGWVFRDQRAFPGQIHYHQLLAIYQTGQGAPGSIRQALEHLIRQDPDYLDPYLLLSELLESSGHGAAASNLVESAFNRGLLALRDGSGVYPASVEWTVQGNRHLVRALHRWAESCWRGGDAPAALDLSRYLLVSSHADPLGVRYNVLALLEGVSHRDFVRGVGGVGSPAWFEAHVGSWSAVFGGLLRVRALSA